MHGAAGAFQNLDLYRPDFSSADFSHAQWRQARHIRLSAARDVAIELHEVRVYRISNELSRVVFKQIYRDQRYADVGGKTLVIQRQEAEWKIRAEEFVKSSMPSQCE